MNERDFSGCGGRSPCIPVQAQDPKHHLYVLSEMVCTPPRQREPHREDQAKEAPWTEADGGGPPHLPDHRFRDGLGTCRHLHTLLPLLPPRVSQNVVLVRTQLEGVRDLHCCYQIRPENLHREKTQPECRGLAEDGGTRAQGGCPWETAPQGLHRGCLHHQWSGFRVSN